MVCPLAACVVCGRYNNLKVFIIVLVIANSLTDPIIGGSLDLSCHVECCVGDEHFAKLGAFTILDSARINVSEHVVEFRFELFFGDLENG